MINIVKIIKRKAFVSFNPVALVPFGVFCFDKVHCVSMSVFPTNIIPTKMRKITV